MHFKSSKPHNNRRESKDSSTKFHKSQTYALVHVSHNMNLMPFWPQHIVVTTILPRMRGYLTVDLSKPPIDSHKHINHAQLTFHRAIYATHAIFSTLGLRLHHINFAQLTYMLIQLYIHLRNTIHDIKFIYSIHNRVKHHSPYITIITNLP